MPLSDDGTKHLGILVNSLLGDHGHAATLGNLLHQPAAPNADVERLPYPALVIAFSADHQIGPEAACVDKAFTKFER